MAGQGALFAVSDLHVAYAENRKLADRLEPESPDDWLLVAGDVGDLLADIERTLKQLRSRWGTVVWAPGNHELWTHPSDPVQLRGEARYRALVQMCRDNGVLTPEDPYPVWPGAGGPVVVAPLFLLYDYSFRAPGTSTKAESLAKAYDTGVVCTDEALLHPDPHPNRESWCWERVAATEKRLSEIDPALPTVLVSHWPLVRTPTEVLWYPEFAQWCGTELTADWHVRFRAKAAVYGHLHIPRSTVYDGVPFEEVSLGYPREWGRRSTAPQLPRRILGGESSGSEDDKHASTNREARTSSNREEHASSNREERASGKGEERGSSNRTERASRNGDERGSSNRTERGSGNGEEQPHA